MYIAGPTREHSRPFFGAKKIKTTFSGQNGPFFGYWRLFRGKHRNGGFLGAIDTFSGLIVLFWNFLGAKEAFSGLIVLFGNFLGAVDPFSGLRRLSRGFYGV